MRNTLSCLLVSIFFLSSAPCSAAPRGVVLPFDVGTSRAYEAYIVDYHSGRCETQERGPHNRYAIRVEPKSGYAYVYIKKETDSYTMTMLTGYADVARTNALDFATFKLYPDGRFEFVNAQDNLQAFRTEKEQVERILATSPPKSFGTDIALSSAKQNFEGKLQREILSRYGMLFDIGQFKDIRSSAQGDLDPSVYFYVTRPFFSYKANFSVTTIGDLKVTTHLRQTGVTPGGRCDPEVLNKHDKSTFFFSNEDDICRTTTTTTTIYDFSQSRHALKSIYRSESKVGTVNNLFPSCTYVEIM